MSSSCFTSALIAPVSTTPVSFLCLLLVADQFLHLAVNKRMHSVWKLHLKATWYLQSPSHPPCTATAYLPLLHSNATVCRSFSGICFMIQLGLIFVISQCPNIFFSSSFIYWLAFLFFPQLLVRLDLFLLFALVGYLSTVAFMHYCTRCRLVNKRGWLGKKAWLASSNKRYWNENN